MSQSVASTPLTPVQRYQHDLQQEGFNYDASQEAAVCCLQSLYDRLVADVKGEQPIGMLARLTGKFKASEPAAPIKGLYFWGGVGRGKTYLMDNFYESLPFEQKMRTHFHRFMRRVHRELKQLKGEKNPLEKVAGRIASETQIICFDEFFVSDIADAMLLGALLEYLFVRRVTLVATSNIIPSNLYENGLQRQRFLPTIALLNKHTDIINVDGGVDYRLRALERAELFHSPLDKAADKALMSAFQGLAPAVGEVRECISIEVEGRAILCRYVAEDVVWFDFDVICNIPRSQYDYIELAREFHAVLVGGVRQMGRKNDDQARRFINMVDEFYDRNVKLVLSAEVDMGSLYADGGLGFEFQRTQSRLLEMQSHEYLARPHRP
ncbi:MAG TPA: cell division protein ZapE [Porticoccus sp.]|nr:cell division protein ZapE [Porticoccus sp.]